MAPYKGAIFLVIPRSWGIVPHRLNLKLNPADFNGRGFGDLYDPNRTYHPDGYIPDWDFMERYIRAIEKIVITKELLCSPTLLHNSRRMGRGYAEI